MIFLTKNPYDPEFKKGSAALHLRCRASIIITFLQYYLAGLKLSFRLTERLKTK